MKHMLVLMDEDAWRRLRVQYALYQQNLRECLMSDEQALLELGSVAAQACAAVHGSSRLCD